MTVVFVSYATEDQAAAASVVAHLKSRGMGIWFDRLDIRAADPIISHIEEGLSRADVVLVMWSRFAAGSRWVRAERDAALYRKYEGAPLRVVMARLDGEALPPLSVAERALDLRNPDARSALLDEELTAPAPPQGRPQAEQLVFDRSSIEEQVLQELRPERPIAVLCCRNGDSSDFTRTLFARLRRERPDLLPVAVPVQPLAQEPLTHYVERIRHLLSSSDTSERRSIVALLYGWSTDHESGHQRVLGQVLREHLDTTGLQTPKLHLVGIGGYPLFLLKYGVGAHSVFNNALPIDLIDLDEKSLFAAMRSLGEERWTQDDARDVHRRTGGHPGMVKNLVIEWLRAPDRGWDEAEKALHAPESFLIPTISRLGADESLRKMMKQLHTSQDGVPYTLVVPQSAVLRLYYEGLLIRDGKRMKIRCRAVASLIRELLETADG
jgi:hypothetical protein